MMGEVSKDFHDEVTHLVAGAVGSKKYKVENHFDEWQIFPAKLVTVLIWYMCFEICCYCLHKLMVKHDFGLVWKAYVNFYFLIIIFNF